VEIATDPSGTLASVHRQPDQSRDPVEIVEVAARDGLQSEPTIVSARDKVELVRRAVAAGVRRAEAVSFVNPARVPQMADAVEVMALLNAPGGLDRRGEVSLGGLVLNARGLDQALDAGVDEINVVVVCSDTYAEHNQGRTTAQLVDVWCDVASRARAAGLPASVTLASAFGCPFEGELSLDRLARVVESIVVVAPDELSLADSIGVATPVDVAERVSLVRAIAPGVTLRAHFHNTRNTGLANAVAAIAAGVRTLDASLGGLGGCPFAPDSTGNIPTEDIVYLLERMGHPTGIDLDALIASVPWLESVVDHPVPGLLAKAGNFPGERRP
jgi:hydroxymethylglutaryl-CoA lyase